MRSRDHRVLEQNNAAQAFYDAVGGKLTGREHRGVDVSPNVAPPP